MANPYVEKTEAGLVITPVGQEYLSRIVTDPSGSVYAFTSEASPLLVAAAMARLSRRADDLRQIYLDEFAASEEKADALLSRVITAFGDDSVQQLMPISLVVENASNLLTKKLEWGRLASYLEQSTRYIFFDQKVGDRYRYYVPENLRPSIRRTYVDVMDDIFSLYSAMVHGVTEFVRKKVEEPKEKVARIAWLGATRAQACDAVRAVLPVATTSTVGIVASAQAIESLILHLESEPLEECSRVGLQILKEARKVAGVFFERTDLPERGGAMVAYRMAHREKISVIAKRLWNEADKINFKPDESIVGPKVTMVGYEPKDELELVSEFLFSECDMSMSEIYRIVDNWSEERKQEVLQEFLAGRLNRRHKPGRALERAHYEWEIIGDYGTFRDLQRHRMVDMWEWQRLTPSYGYEVTELVQEAGFTDTFQRCFQISSSLFRTMNQHSYEEEAQYATLLGNLMRYRFMVNARESFHIHELRTTPQGHPGYRKIVKEMHRQLCGVHPIIGGAMRFVNTGEDPELTRMAAELATQKKLDLLQKK